MTKFVPIMVLISGVILMVFKIVSDSEPGALPLLIILASALWLWRSHVSRPLE